MNELVRTILIMSISGGIIALLLFALKPLVRNRLPKSVQYYFWLVVVAALLIPISVFFKLPAATENTPTIMSPSNVVERYFITGEEEMDRMGALDSYGAREASNPIYMHAVKEAESPISSVVTFFSFIYPLGVLIALLFYVTNYSVYVRLYRRRNTVATSDELAMLTELSGGERVPFLFRNPLAATPMMIGMFRPTIILPDREYTNEHLRAILVHELTHLQRKDILVKWLSVLACSLHWFNPIVWLVRREIDRACELSCDEAVIRNLDIDGKQNYGETLLYVATDAKTPHAVLSTTMCEEKKALKERLSAIMKSKKHTRLAIIVSAVLIVAIGCTAIALGAGRNGNTESTTNRNLQYIGFNGFSLGGAVSSDMTSTLTPTDRYTSGEYDYNYEEARFSLDAETGVIRKLWVNVSEIGVVCSLDETTSRSPWTTISQIRGYFGEGIQGWQDREQKLRYAEHIQTQGRLAVKLRFVYADDEYDRLIWVIAESNLPYSSPTNGIINDELVVFGIDRTPPSVDPQPTKPPTYSPFISSWKPLHELPVDYSTEQAVADSVYVNIHGSQIYNEVMVDQFYADVYSGGGAAFLRVMQCTIEGDAILVDYQYDGEMFTVTHDSTRDKFGEREITTYNYKFLVADDRSADQPLSYYLSNEKNIFAGMGNALIEGIWQLPAPSTQAERAPKLEVTLTTNGFPEQRIEAAQLTTSWMYIDENGNSVGYESESPHALQLDNYEDITLRLNGSSGEVTFNFGDSYKPQSVSVQRWDAAYYMGRQYIESSFNQNEPVTVNGNTLRISNDVNDYIYEVYAVFEQGSSYYAFRVNASN